MQQQIASRIIGVLAHELYQRVFRLGRFGSDWLVSVYWRHDLNLSQED
jgi:hypothetical protein